MTPAEKLNEAKRLATEARQDIHTFLKDDRSRKRGAAMRLGYEADRLLGLADMFFSQAGQDRVIRNLIKSKRKGVFVDVGGYDGITGSNTLHFEKFLGWTGILIEPSPVQLNKAKEVRSCACLGYAASGETGKAEFLEVTQGYTQMSGFLDSYDPDLLARVRGNPAHRETIHTLQKRRLNDILEDQNIRKIDYVSLDVEGGEISILKDFDFNRFDVTLWSIENNTKTPQIHEIMSKAGYELVEFAGEDEIYRKKASADE